MFSYTIWLIESPLVGSIKVIRLGILFVWVWSAVGIINDKQREPKFFCERVAQHHRERKKSTGRSFSKVKDEIL